jgi:hypothetical protein
MAFIRKRGGRYYLVHNVRQKDGGVRQIHLAGLGRRPRISERVIEDVKSKHPFVQVDWRGLKEKALQELVQPFADDSAYLRELIAAIQNINLDIAELHLPVLEATMGRELTRQLVSALKLLSTTLDVKLSQRRRSKPLRLER